MICVSKRKSNEIIDQIVKNLDNIRLENVDSIEEQNIGSEAEYCFSYKGKNFVISKSSSLLSTFGPPFRLKLKAPQVNLSKDDKYIQIYPYRSERPNYAFDSLRDFEVERKLRDIILKIQSYTDDEVDRALGDSFFEDGD